MLLNKRKLSQQEGRLEEARDINSTKNLRGNGIRGIKFLSRLAFERNRDT